MITNPFLRKSQVIFFSAVWISGVATAQPTSDPEGRGPHTSRQGARILPLPKEDGVWHFIVFGDRTGGPAAGIKVLRQAVRDTNLLDPDLVMTVGDLIQGYNGTPEWLEQMREYKSVMSGLERPWYPVAGNHDVYWRGPGRPPGGHEHNYEKHFGPLWYWFRHKNAAFVILYSDEGDPTDDSKGFSRERHIQFSSGQLSWLEDSLAKMKDARHVFVFMHHPRWDKRAYKEKNNWDAAHTLLKAAGNVTAVFAGHTHRLRHGGFRDGIEYTTLAATGAGLPRHPVAQAGFLHHMNLVTVRDSGISQATIPIGAVMDPRDMTVELQDELDRLLQVASPSATSPLVIASDGSAHGTYAFELENPSQHPVALTMRPDPGNSMLRILPDHVHLTLEPGQAKPVTFDYQRTAIGLANTFGVPALSVSMDLLAKTSRISLPQRRWIMDTRLRAKPAELGEVAVNGALDLDGRSACVAMDLRRLRLPQGPFTVEGWLKVSRFTSRQPFLAKSENSEFYVFVNEGHPSFGVHLDGRYVEARSADRKLETGTWHHVAGVFDGTELRVYLDGALVAKTKGAGARKTNEFPFYVGADPNRHGQPVDFLEGQVDEVRISTVARYVDESFVPEQRFEADPQTLLLLHCDSNPGPFALDAGRAGHGLRLGRARCVPRR